MKINAFDRYKDRSGKLYQVITTAVSLSTEQEEVIVQQLYGSYLNIAIAEDQFFRIFSKEKDSGNEESIPAEEYQEPEKRAKEVKTEPPKASEVKIHPSPATVETDDSSDDSEQDPAVRDMLAFLDTDDLDEKYMIIEHMAQNDELNDTYIDNMAASIDIVIDDGPLDSRIRELMKCLDTRKRFENTRLRS
ncbi:MAG: hypothetical protein ACI4CS_09265 [Candidatus Weimeria sp.]